MSGDLSGAQLAAERIGRGREGARVPLLLFFDH